MSRVVVIAVAEERRVAELGDERGRVVMVARHEVHGYRAAPQDGPQGGVLVRVPGVREVAGDDDAVRPRLDREHAADRFGEVRGGQCRQGPSHQVRVTEVGDPHVLERSNWPRRRWRPGEHGWRPDGYRGDMNWTWNVRSNDGAMNGLEFAKCTTAGGFGRVLIHAAPASAKIEVIDGDDRVVARADLERSGEYSPMTLIELDGPAMRRSEVW